jgi:hypothetical protein
MRELRGHEIPGIVKAAASDNLPALPAFATGLTSDLGALTAGPSVHWNPGMSKG